MIRKIQTTDLSRYRTGEISKHTAEPRQKALCNHANISERATNARSDGQNSYCHNEFEVRAGPSRFLRHRNIDTHLLLYLYGQTQHKHEENSFLTLLLLGAICTSQARARIPIGTHEKTVIVLELPDSTYYQTDADNYIDLGYTYKVFEIAHIPVWTVDKGGLVGYTEAEPDTNYQLDDEVMGWIREDTGIEDLDELGRIPFWDAWGGKLVVLALVAGYLIYTFGRKKPEEETEE